LVGTHRGFNDFKKKLKSILTYFVKSELFGIKDETNDFNSSEDIDSYIVEKSVCILCIVVFRSLLSWESSYISIISFDRSIDF
jgi:hypothetical protein